MVDAKIDASVIQAYIKSSLVLYNLKASEIIALKDHGVSPEIVTAMIQRGGELRDQAYRGAETAATPPAQSPYPATATPYAPVPMYDYSTQPDYSASNYGYPSYTYAYPAYSYGYPGYGGGYFGIGYGGWGGCWPSAYWGCFPYRSYCGYGGFGYPWYRGYWGGGYWGGRGWGNSGFRGGAFGHGAAFTSFPGHATGFRSFGVTGRSVAFTGHNGSFGGHVGGFSGHAGGFGGMRSASFGGHAGGFGGHGGRH
jgi:hypothetical protein